MQLRILGCSGGIGGALRTTAMLADDDILIDGGTGVGDLSLEALTRIDHVFITHTHLDHIACIPLMIDSVARYRSKPITLYTTAAVQRILKEHIFNWQVWPDFTRIPKEQTPFMRYETISVGQTVVLGERRITPIPAQHTVPAVGYHLDSGRASLIFTGDTTSQDALWDYVNGVENLRYLIIETAFSEQQHAIALASQHLSPALLAKELSKLKRAAEIFVTHLKPGEDRLIMDQIQHLAQQYAPQELTSQQVFDF